jgi:ribosome maturation protein SDO1
MSLVQPLGQKLLSNVSIVKLDRRGKHFEIAALPNKVLSWRSGLEPDIDEVVQSHSIFVNVDQGKLATTATVLDCLAVDNMEDALRLILAEGKIALAEKERRIKIINTHKDIASIVASQCVNANTHRPLTVTMVERAMRAIGFSVKLNKAPKAQALTVIRLLQRAMYPITRAPIRLKLVVRSEDTDKLADMLPIIEAIERTDVLTTVIGQVDPGHLRPLVKRIGEEIGPEVVIEILEVKATAIKAERTGDTDQPFPNDGDEMQDEPDDVPELQSPSQPSSEEVRPKRDFAEALRTSSDDESSDETDHTPPGSD